MKNIIVITLLSGYWFPFFLSAQEAPQTIGVGQNSHIMVTTSSNQTGNEGENTLSLEGFTPNDNAAARFLHQASFGPTYEEILNLKNIGIENWIDQQFNTPKAFSAVDKVLELTAIKNANGAANPRPTGQFWQYAFWEYTLTSPDVLRQRVAFALSELLVIAETEFLQYSPITFSNYYDLLLDHSFGNYRNLLEAVTYHPAMGTYLTYMNNPKQQTVRGQVIFPDENYAREVMQLFTIGLCELNIDGSCQTDVNGDFIPTYDNEDIAEFSKIFTGLSWGDSQIFNRTIQDSDFSYNIPMKMYNDSHEPGVKQLLRGYTVAAKNPVDGDADIREALDNLFQHPNVGPFVGKFLIQRLVTANPSPAYIERVARAFNGESQYGTERGDMKATIKAILLDDEARSCTALSDDEFGMLREPFIRYLQLCRSFNIHTENNVYRNAMPNLTAAFGQRIFQSPSVFNFFQSNFQPLGPIEEAGLVAPVFQITNSQTLIGYMNALNEWVFRDNLIVDWGPGYSKPLEPGDIPSLNLSAELALVADEDLPALIDRLNLLLTHGQLSEYAQEQIIVAIQSIPLNQAIDRPIGIDLETLRLLRVKMAIFLVMSSPEYLINR